MVYPFPPILSFYRKLITILPKNLKSVSKNLYIAFTKITQILIMFYHISLITLSAIDTALSLDMQYFIFPWYNYQNQEINIDPKSNPVSTLD